MVRKHIAEDELRERLDPVQYHVTQEAGTERAFTGVYWDCHDDGVYRCVVCDEPLFRSDTKFESGTGWPSFWQPVSDDAVETHTDTSHGMVRTEAVCAQLRRPPRARVPRRSPADRPALLHEQRVAPPRPGRRVRRRRPARRRHRHEKLNQSPTRGGPGMGRLDGKVAIISGGARGSG